MFDKIVIVSVAVAGFTEWFKNFLPENVKGNNGIMAAIAAGFSILGAVGYQFASKAIDPNIVLTWQGVVTFTVVVVGLVQTAYNLLIQTFRAVVTKLKAKTETPIDPDKVSDEIVDAIGGKLDEAVKSLTEETKK